MTTGRHPDAERSRQALCRLVGLAGVSRVEMSRRLQGRGFTCDVQRALTGRTDLRLWQVLAIVEAVDMAPAEFFRMVFKAPKEPSPFRRQLEIVATTLHE
jgi:hypothetical protein